MRNVISKSTERSLSFEEKNETNILNTPIDSNKINERKSILRFTTPPVAPSNIFPEYLSKQLQIKVTAPPVNASKIKNAKMNFNFLFIFIGFGAMYPIKNRPTIANIGFIIGISGNNMITTAINAPNTAEKINLLPLEGIFENKVAKYSDNKSTVKFIRKYTSI